MSGSPDTKPRRRGFRAARTALCERGCFCDPGSLHRPMAETPPAKDEGNISTFLAER